MHLNRYPSLCMHTKYTYRHIAFLKPLTRREKALYHGPIMVQQKLPLSKLLHTKTKNQSASRTNGRHSAIKLKASITITKQTGCRLVSPPPKSWCLFPNRSLDLQCNIAYFQQLQACNKHGLELNTETTQVSMNMPKQRSNLPRSLTESVCSYI